MGLGTVVLHSSHSTPMTMLNTRKIHSTATRMEPIFCTQNGREITKTSWTRPQRFKLQFGCPEVEVLEGAQALGQGGVDGHALQIRRKMKARFEKHVSITSPNLEDMFLP